MIREDITQNDEQLLENILSLMEYAYRMGIYHGAQVKDPVKINELDEVSIGKRMFRILVDAPDKPIRLDRFRDIVVVWCSRVNAMYLRNMLRSDIKLYSFRTAILVMAFVYYRDGAHIGLNYTRADAKKLLDTVYRGKVHYNAVTRKKVTKAVFFDEMKYKTNLLHYDLTEAGEKSGLNTLSTFMGTTWIKANL